jgi:hypothetical protein
MQTCDDNATKELGFDKNKRKDNVEGLNVIEVLFLPPPIDISKASYIKKKKRSTRLSTTKN